MSWTTPATWSVGESPTAAKLNAQIRDNLSYLYDPPAVALAQNSTQTIQNAIWSKGTFDAELLDNAGFHDNSTNPTRITFPTAGNYLLAATVPLYSVTNAVAIGGRFQYNNGGALQVFGQSLVAGSSQDGNGPALSTIILAYGTGDFVELEIFQNSGGTVGTLASFAGVTFCATRL